MPQRPTGRKPSGIREFLGRTHSGSGLLPLLPLGDPGLEYDPFLLLYKQQLAERLKETRNPVCPCAGGAAP